MSVVDAIGFRKIDGVKRLQESAYRSWFSGLVCSVIASVYTLYRLSEKQKTLDLKEGEGVVEAKKLEKYVPLASRFGINKKTNDVKRRESSAARIQLFSDLSDLVIPASAIGLANFDDGFVGIAGTTSSLIGLWSQWRKTA